MTDLAPFPNVKLCLIELLTDLAETATRTPAGLASRLPFNRITISGGRDDLRTDVVRVDVDSFAATEQESDDLAESVRQRLLTGPHQVAGAVLDRASTDTRPRQLPWSDSVDVWRCGASYRVSARR